MHQTQTTPSTGPGTSLAEKPARHRARRSRWPTSIDRKGTAAGVLACAMGCALAWLGGYDFATRSVEVAVGAAVILCAALLAALAASSE